MSGAMSEGAGREYLSDERAPYSLIIVIICVECGAEECGANFHAVLHHLRHLRDLHGHLKSEFFLFQLWRSNLTTMSASRLRYKASLQTPTIWNPALAELVANNGGNTTGRVGFDIDRCMHILPSVVYACMHSFAQHMTCDEQCTFSSSLPVREVLQLDSFELLILVWECLLWNEWPIHRRSSCFSFSN